MTLKWAGPNASKWPGSTNLLMQNAAANFWSLIIPQTAQSQKQGQVRKGPTEIARKHEKSKMMRLISYYEL